MSSDKPPVITTIPTTQWGIRNKIAKKLENNNIEYIMINNQDINIDDTQETIQLARRDIYQTQPHG